VADATGGDMAAFSFGGPSTNNGGLGQWVRGDPDYLRTYADHYAALNPWRPALIRLGRPRFVATSEQLVDDETYSKSAFFGEWMQPQGLRHQAVIILRREHGRISGLNILRRGARGPFDAKEMAFLRRIAAELVEAMTIERRLCAGRLLHAASEEALADSDTAVVVLGDGGRTLQWNRAARAILDRTDGLRITGDRLRAAAPTDDARLGAIIDVALRPASGEDVDRRRMTVTRPSGARPFELRAVPIPRKVMDGPERALVLIRDPAATADPLTSPVHLSPRQAQIAEWASFGHTIDEIAGALACSPHTVKTQLKRTYQKLGVSTRAQLARALSRGGLHVAADA
jgi:DNA-binding CsgD family transcriptional regulator